MPAIEERTTKSGLRYRVRWALPKGGRRVSETFDTRGWAEEFAALVDAAGGYYPHRWVPGHGFRDVDPGAVMFKDAAVEALARRRTTASPATYARYEKTYETQFLPRWGDWAVDEIKLRDVQDWVDSQHTAGVAPKTIANARGVLSAIMLYARHQGWRETNPCADLIMPRKRPVPPEHGYLTREQVALIIERTKPDAQLLVWSASATGARWGELTALTGTDIIEDDNGTWVRINKAWSDQPDAAGVKHAVLGPPKTDAAMRFIYVPETAGRVLRDRAALVGGGYLFTTGSGGPWRYSNFHEGRWKPALTAARAIDQTIPLDTRFHHLRHSYAWWAMEDHDAVWVQKQMGHTSVEMTARVYGGMTRATRAKQAQRVTAMLAIEASADQVGHDIDVPAQAVEEVG